MTGFCASLFLTIFFITATLSCTIKLLMQISSSECKLNVSFGCFNNNNSMWTTSGCRGIFKCNNASNIECESQNNAFTVCQCVFVPKFHTYLLLDNRNIIEKSGVQMVLGPVKKSKGNPLLKEDQPWEMRFDNMQPNTWWDPERSKWRLWYNTFSSCSKPISEVPDCQAKASPCPDLNTASPGIKRKSVGVSRGGVICYADSDDGVTWHKPNLGLVSWNGSKQNNILFDVGTDSAGGGLGAGVTLDLNAPLTSRWKLCTEKNRNMLTGISSDGLTWQTREITNTEGRFDTHKNTIFDAKSGRWISYLRCTPTTHGLRIQCYIESESADYKNTSWGVATPTELNTTDTYQPDALVAFPYAGIWLGFANVFNPTHSAGPTAPNTVNMVLTWSSDAREWKYIKPDQSFVPRESNSGSWDCCGVFGAKQSPEQTPAFLQGATTLPIYYAGCNGLFFGARACGLGLVEVGRHAFAGYTGPGIITTAPVKVNDDFLLVTASGGVQVGVVDDDKLSLSACTPIDGTEVIVKWAGKTQGTLAPYLHGAITLTFKIPDGAILYAYHL